MSKVALEKLKDDLHYYGDFGRTYLSNSDISKLLNDPLNFKVRGEFKVAYLFGSYFHVAALEPHKVDKFTIVDAKSRRSKVYKEAVGDGHGLLLKEKHQADEMIAAVRVHEEANDLVFGDNVEYEAPGVGTLEDLPWKGKADIVNHGRELVVDLKSTRNVDSFDDSIFKFNYDSQAYIYYNLFGYKLCFVAVDKRNCNIKIVHSTDEMLESGAEKVRMASDVYKEMFADIGKEYYKKD